MILVKPGTFQLYMFANIGKWQFGNKHYFRNTKRKIVGNRSDPRVLSEFIWYLSALSLSTRHCKDLWCELVSYGQCKRSWFNSVICLTSRLFADSTFVCHTSLCSVKHQLCALCMRRRKVQYIYIECARAWNDSIETLLNSPSVAVC